MQCMRLNSNCTKELDISACYMTEAEMGGRDALAGVRLLVSTLSILGTVSIIVSAVLKKQVLSPKVHPIFVLSIADFMLAMLWVFGGGLWLRRDVNMSRVWCFSASLMTVILECITINLTLVYALLAYSTIKHCSSSTINLDGSPPPVEHACGIWHPLRTVTVYFIAWILPVILIMIPFGIISGLYGLVKDAQNCSCWCLPMFGNVLPFAARATDLPTACFLYQMRKISLSYGAVVSVHYLVVFFLLLSVYWRILHCINAMRRKHAQTRSARNYGAVANLLVWRQSQARKRVVYFITVFIVCGFFNLVLSLLNLVYKSTRLLEERNKLVLEKSNYVEGDSPPAFLLVILFTQSVTVPLQGFLNAIVYGWTREDFVVTAGVKNNSNLLSSYGTALESEKSMNDDDENYLEQEATMTIETSIEQETEMEDNDGS